MNVVDERGGKDFLRFYSGEKSVPDLVDVVVAEVDADEPGCVLEQFHLDLLHSIPRQILIFYVVKISHYKLNRGRR